MPNLKPCPFCGSAAEHVAESSVLLAECSNMKCTMHDWAWDIATWNTRPIEDALQARIASLEAENEALKANAIVWHKYPDEKPDSRGDYFLVATTKYVHYRDEGSGGEYDKVTKVPFVRVAFWYNPGSRFEMSGGQLNGVYAWAYLPAPPKEES